MSSLGSIALVVGGAMSAFAAVAHLACIGIGAPAYRVMGGEQSDGPRCPGGKISASADNGFHRNDSVPVG